MKTINGAIKCLGVTIFIDKNNSELILIILLRRFSFESSPQQNDNKSSQWYDKNKKIRTKSIFRTFRTIFDPVRILFERRVSGSVHVLRRDRSESELLRIFVDQTLFDLLPFGLLTSTFFHLFSIFFVVDVFYRVVSVERRRRSGTFCTRDDWKQSTGEPSYSWTHCSRIRLCSIGFLFLNLNVFVYFSIIYLAYLWFFQ